MNIDHIVGNFGAQSIDKSRFKQSKEVSGANKEEKSRSASKADSVKISREARELRSKESLVKLAVKELQKFDDVRLNESDMLRIQAKIQMGYYDREGVREEVVESLLQEEIHNTTIESKEADNTSVVEQEFDNEKIQRVKNRVESGFYDKKSIQKSIVDELLR